MRSILSLCLFLISASILLSQNFSGGFNFNLPASDSTAQRFLPEFPADPIQDFIGIDADGHFEADGLPIRFWGVNLTTGACFPVKEKASFIAARMRKMGINLVRFHHMDNPWTGNEGTIFDRNLNNTRSLDPVTLDRLHYFLAQLKRNNIYVNMNLHVSRTFKEGDGVLHADSIVDFGKAVTYFDDHLVDLQKEYAEQLLTSVNPYTGLAMVDDPVLGMVEIANENTLYGFWKDNRLQPFSAGGSILSRHADTLDMKWHAFLEQKYGTTENLQTAWEEGSGPTGPGNLLEDGGFESGNISTAWQLELHETAAASISIEQSNTFEGSYAGRVQVTNVTDTDWHVQFKQAGFNLEAGKNYVLRFNARASQNRSLGLVLMRDNAPYTYYSGTTFSVDTDWDAYTFTFTAPENNFGNGRVTFNFQNQTGTVWFDDIRLEEPVLEGLGENESLSAGTVRRFPYSERLVFSPQRVADMAEFYISVQRDFYDDMYIYLKDELGVQVPITGTNALVGPADVISMESLDYIDDHAYWNHPWFPNEPWSATDWLMENNPMIRQSNLGTLSGIFSGLAIEGKPYTISEYNHPFPNRFQTEMMPLLMAYASFHDADGLMFFEYSGGSPSDWEADMVPGFFEIHRNHALMGLSPILGYAYRNRLLEPATNFQTISYSPEYVYKEIPQQDNFGRWGKFVPYDPNIGLSQPIRTASYNATSDPDLDNLPVAQQGTFTSSTNEVEVNTEEGSILVETPNFVSVSGFLNDAIGAVVGPVELVDANDFGVLAWMSLSDTALTETRNSIIVLSSKIQNSNMIWNGIETVNNNWGTAPTSIFPLDVTLKLDLEVSATHLRVYPLNTVGKESTYFNVLPDSDGTFALRLNQNANSTLWFGIEASDGPVSVREELWSQLQLELFPNPVSAELSVSYQLSKANTIQFEVLDLLGRTLWTNSTLEQKQGNHLQTIETSRLPAGMYTLKMKVGNAVRMRKFVKN